MGEIYASNSTLLNNEIADLVYNNKYRTAVIKINQALEMEPNNVTALNRKGEVLNHLGKTDEDKYYKAIESYDEVLNLEPNNVTALNGKGEVLIAG